MNKKPSEAEQNQDKICVACFSTRRLILPFALLNVGKIKLTRFVLNEKNKMKKNK